MRELQPEGGQRGVVLVVDDAQENVDVLVGLLRQDYRVKAALNGSRALAIARRTPPPDVILLDVEMPDLDGYEVCSLLQSDAATRSVPVIFITARGTVDDKIRGFDCGAVDYVTKPFDAAEVRARVKTHIELQRARETIRRHNQELEGLLDARTRELVRSERQAAFGQLVQGIVHNLRNPLAAIVMSLDELAAIQKIAQEAIARNDLEALSAPMGETDTPLRVAITAGKRINQMLNTLMAKSRSDRARYPTRIDLNDLVRTELEFLEADPRFKHGLEKVISLSPDPIPIEAVSGDLAQVFHNLVRNALDAMHGCLLRRLEITTRVDGARVVLSVSDTGSGIPEAVRDRVFDPFFTTKPAEEDVPSGDSTPAGNGLGLWMCQQAVIGCGGRIQFETTVGQGTTFLLTLPASVAARRKESPQG